MVPNAFSVRLAGALALVLLALSALTPARASNAASTPFANEIRVTGDEARTRVTIELDRQVPVAAFLLADPARVIIDMPAIEFRLPADAGRTGKGLVRAFRYGQFAPGKSRIVIDARLPVLIEKQTVQPGVAEGEPTKIVFELVRASKEEFRRAVDRDARALERAAPRPAAAVDPRPATGDTARGELPLVVLDPGHGGIDSGAMALDGTPEKAMTLEIASAVKAALEASGRVRVQLTRDDDTFVSLGDRVKFARDRQAALFLSIHCDSYGRPFLGVSGASVYTLSETASDQEAAAYADRENRADQIAGVEVPPENNEVADILFDLMHRETKNFSVHFARLLVDDLKPSVRMVKNPHRFAGFRVLRAPDVPSALLELGYLSNKDDLKLLLAQDWREKVVGKISHAVLAFIASSQVRSTSATAPQQ